MRPGTIKVMEPVSARDIPSAAGYTYQVKWDGLRMLAFIDSGVALQNRRMRIKTGTFPEFHNMGAMDNQPMVLDGEIVVVRNKKPDFPAVLKRNFHSTPPPGYSPAQFIVFDLLCYQGWDIRKEPLSSRQEYLKQLKFPTGVILAEDFSNGTQLFEKIKDLGWEGVVAKKLSSPYVAGKSAYWQKIKTLQRDVFTIIGYTINQGRLASLQLATDDDKLQVVGSVGSGISARTGQDLLTLLRSIEQDGRLPPVLKAEVEFAQWTGDMRLRAPVLKRIFAGDRESDHH